VLGNKLDYIFLSFSLILLIYLFILDKPVVYSNYDVNAIASAIKQFFRDLPDPLLTFALYESFITATSENHVIRIFIKITN
jgi:hypothetical protein